MAPSFEEPVAPASLGQFTVPKKAVAGDNKFLYDPGRTTVEQHVDYAHEDLLPSFPSIHWDPIQHISYEDRGLRGDPKFRNLLQDATAIFDYNPKIGTEIHGVDLSKLTDAQRDDLARLIAYRGVVFFRAQKSFDVEAQRKLGNYFGKLHKVSHSSSSGVDHHKLIYHSMQPQPYPGRRVLKMSTSCIAETTRLTIVLCSARVSCGTLMYVLERESSKDPLLMPMARLPTKCNHHPIPP